MKKLTGIIAALLLFAIPMTVAASESDIAERTGADSLTEEYGSDTDFSKVFSVIRESLENFWKTALKSLFLMLSMVLLSSVFNNYGSGSTLHSALTYASVLAVSGCAFSVLTSVFGYAGESIASLCRYMTAFLPVAAALHTLGGSVASGVAGSSALLLFLSVASGFSSGFLFPLMQGGFVMSLASALPGSGGLKSVTTLAKNALTTLLAFVFSIFGMVMYLQTVITAAADNFAFRTVKFAAGTFIPVIGSMLGDAARTVSSSAGVVRATVGGAGIIALLGLTLPAVIYTLIYKLCFLCCAMAARALGCDNESRLLYDINSVLSVLLALQLGISVMFVIAVALFIRIGVDV